MLSSLFFKSPSSSTATIFDANTTSIIKPMLVKAQQSKLGKGVFAIKRHHSVANTLVILVLKNEERVAPLEFHFSLINENGVQQWVSSEKAYNKNNSQSPDITDVDNPQFYKLVFEVLSKHDLNENDIVTPTSPNEADSALSNISQETFGQGLQDASWVNIETEAKDTSSLEKEGWVDLGTEILAAAR